ncbi:hypothetical protein [Streptomyces beijiangensis]|uniref:Secreted protein n=1 Tax=Streptomyces beijiangensis TaxID=163361 RepID=A0A939JJR5_9ACTN|nr:hypothetical protein [Streptomyces beijiangensis]MBO0513919.1 hypothetical protein [Streptomyces beijiangensis]
MRLKRLLFVAASAVATLLIPMGTTPASAAPPKIAYSDISMNYASGRSKVEWGGTAKLTHVYLYVKDNLADGHSVTVRLVTQGAPHDWPLHRVATGAGTYGEWLTYADLGSSSIISYAWIEICQMEGNVKLKCNPSKPMANPYVVH